MPKTTAPQDSEEQKRDDLIKSFSQAAARAHDKGHDAAAYGLTEATLLLINGKKEK